VRESLCEASESLPTFAIPHHPNATTNTTTKPWANNLATVWNRCWLSWLAWKLELLSRVALMPRRGTHSDELPMNPQMNGLLRLIHPTAWKWNSQKFTCRIVNIRPYGLVLCAI